MAVVRLRAPLSELAGGHRELELDGGTVAEVLLALERAHPGVTRLDPRRARSDPRRTSTSSSTRTTDGRTRRSAQMTGCTSSPRSREDEMTELLVGTKKGLFVLEGDGDGSFEVTARAFAGEPVEFATRDPRTGRTFAAVTSAFYGPKLFYSDDLAGEWAQAEGIVLPEDAEKPMTRLWAVVPGEADGLLYAGGDPGVLFESRDGGETWELNQALLGAADASGVEPRRGRACACTRSRPGPATRRGSRSRSRRSASGSPTTAAQTWRHGNKGLVPALHAGGGTRRHDRPVRPQHAPRAGAARAPLHPVPRRRLPLRRRGRVLDEHRRGPALGLRVPARRSTRPTRTAPTSSRSSRIWTATTPEGKVRVYETRDAGATLDGTRRRPAVGQRVPHDPAPGVLRRRLRAVDAPVLRCDVGRRLRVERRGEDVVHGGDEPAAGALGASRVTKRGRAFPGIRRSQPSGRSLRGRARRSRAGR